MGDMLAKACERLARSLGQFGEHSDPRTSGTHRTCSRDVRMMHAVAASSSQPDDIDAKAKVTTRAVEVIPASIAASTDDEATAGFGDSALVAELKAGSARAYERVIRELGPRLLTTAQRMLGNEEDAKDAVQDAFLSAFRNIHTFDGNSKVSTWLHRIVINASLMKLRTRRRKPAVSIDALLPRFSDEGHMELPIASWREKDDGERYDAETRRRVRDEVENLPDEYRTVIMLRDIEGLDTAEAAAVLNISESAVKTRLHRARQALRERLAELFGAGTGSGETKGGS